MPNAPFLRCSAGPEGNMFRGNDASLSYASLNLFISDSATGDGLVAASIGLKKGNIGDIARYYFYIVRIAARSLYPLLQLCMLIIC
jgi:hypothetical protein